AFSFASADVPLRLAILHMNCTYPLTRWPMASMRWSRSSIVHGGVSRDLIAAGPFSGWAATEREEGLAVMEGLSILGRQGATKGGGVGRGGLAGPRAGRRPPPGRPRGANSAGRRCRRDLRCRLAVFRSEVSPR